MTTVLLMQYIFSPLFGGLIGYITNDIAIRMIFRPHKPKFIFGHRIPFTPGLIPRERERIAKAIGLSISDNLMNKDVLESTLLSAEMVSKVESAVDEYISRLKCDNRLLRDFISPFLKAKDMEICEYNLRCEIVSAVTEEIQRADLGDRISHIAVEHAIQKIDGGIAGMLGGGKLARLLQEPAEQLLRANINEMIALQGSAVIEEMAGGCISGLLDRRLSELLSGKEEQLNAIKSSIVNLYRTSMGEELPRILETLNIPRIIEGRINSMDIEEMEELIIRLMEKELKAIVWFGAGLGFVLGCLNWINFY